MVRPTAAYQGLKTGCLQVLAVLSVDPVLGLISVTVVLTSGCWTAWKQYNLSEPKPELGSELPVRPAGPKLPVTIITGFLGAGKTTLVHW